MQVPEPSAKTITKPTMWPLPSTVLQSHIGMKHRESTECTNLYTSGDDDEMEWCSRALVEYQIVRSHFQMQSVAMHKQSRLRRKANNLDLGCCG